MKKLFNFLIFFLSILLASEPSVIAKASQHNRKPYRTKRTQNRNKTQKKPENNWLGLNKKLALPSNIQDKRFEYIYSISQRGWSCGYNCLFNACNIECLFGRNNQYKDLNKFKQTCLQFISRRPSEDTYSDELEMLANMHLNLQKTVILVKNNNNIRPDIYYESVNSPNKFVYYSSQMTESEAIKMFEKRKIQELKNYLAQNKGLPTFIHFICHVPGHWILISLVQKPNGERSFYIFDNLNSNITNRSSITKHIQYLSNNF